MDSLEEKGFCIGMKWNKIVIMFLFVILVCVFQTCFVQASENEKNKAMYMWEVSGVNFSDYNKIVDYLKINKVYAYIGTAKLASKIGNEE